MAKACEMPFPAHILGLFSAQYSNNYWGSDSCTKMEEIFLLIAYKLWMCVSFIVYVFFLFLLAIVPGLGSLWVCHPVCHASAESALAELLWDGSDCHETSAQQQVSCIYQKIHLLSPLLPNETAIDFLNVHKNLKSHLKYMEVTFYSRGRNGE